MTEPVLPASPPRALGGESVLRAVFYMMLAVTAFPFLSASVKYLGRIYPMP